MLNLNASTSTLADIEGPSDDDLLAVEAVEEDTDWESLLPPVITQREAEDYWNEDENVHDDRYDGDGVPSWSAWA